MSLQIQLLLREALISCPCDAWSLLYKVGSWRDRFIQIRKGLGLGQEDFLQQRSFPGQKCRVCDGCSSLMFEYMLPLTDPRAARNLVFFVTMQP